MVEIARDELWTRVMKELGHDPIKTEDGDLDIFVCGYDFCNGPGCASCGESWCHHCIRNPHDIGPCSNPVIDARTEATSTTSGAANSATIPAIR